MNELGDYLKKLRKGKSLSIRKASEGIGISHTYLDSLEKGYDPRTKKERKPTPEVLQKLSDFYEVNYEYLLYLASYISQETYNQQMKLKKELEQRKTSLQDATRNYFEADSAFDLLLEQYEDLKEKVKQSALGEGEKSRLLESYRQSMEKVRGRAIEANNLLSDTLQTVKMLEEKYDTNITLLSEKKEGDFEVTLATDEPVVPTTVFVPKYRHSDNKDLTELSSEDRVRELLDLKRLLNSDLDVYYDDKKLLEEEKNKVLSMIEVILK